MEALAAQGPLEGLSELDTVLHDPAAEVRLTLVRALAQADGQTGDALLIKALADSDPEVRLKALAGLTREGLGREGLGQVSSRLPQLLGDPHPGVRAAAALALGRLGHGEASGFLIRLLSDPEPTVRRAAAAAIQELEGGWS